MAVQISNLVYEPITDGLDAVHQRILDAVQAKIELLALETEAGEALRVKQYKSEFLEALTFPCVVLTSQNLAETMPGGTNATDDVGYPVYVGFLTRTLNRQETQPEELLWRERVSRALRFQRLPGVPEVMTCQVEADVVFTAEGSEGLLFQAGALTFRFLTREPRGLGA
jgi:hypothetical protein